MNKYTEATEVINKMAEVKMTMNAHKGSIEDVDPTVLIQLMRQEIEELESAVDNDDMLNIIEEAADIQNFLLGLIQQQMNKYRSRENVNNK